MKKVKLSFPIYLFLNGLCILATLSWSGCKSDDGESLTEQQIATNNLSQTWDIFNNGTVLRDNSDITSDYPGFTITFSDGTYTSTGGGDLWKPTSNGTWMFANSNTTTEIVINSKSIGVNITENSLSLDFTVVDENDGVGRVTSLSGQYTIIVQQ